MNTNKIERNLHILGINVKISEIDIPLPIAYKYKYTINTIRFNNDAKEFLLIKEKRKGILENFISQASFIANKANMNYILIFNNMTTEDISFLVNWNIPFIDYSGSLFLPFLTLLLKEPNFLELPKLMKLSPSEQLLISYLLSLEKNKTITIEQIQEEISLSQATLYRGINKFNKYHWIEKKGKDIQIKSKLELFENIKNFLYYPISEILYLTSTEFHKIYINGKQHFLLSGDHALEKSSMLIAKDNTKRYAISKKNFKTLSNSIEMKINYYSKIKLPGSIAIELWDYQPYHLKREEVIDPLSIYVSQLDKYDSRTEKEIDIMILDYLEGR